MSTHGIIIFIVFTVLMLGVALYFTIGEICYRIALKRKAKTSKIVRDKVEVSKEDYAVDDVWFDAQEFDVIKTETFDGLHLNAYYKNYKVTRKVAVLIHGYFGTPYMMTPYAKMFKKMGYNVVIPSNRAHYTSEGEFVGMGWLDKEDIKILLERVIEIFGSKCEIDILGVSMGGATVAMLAGEELPKNVKHLICDSAYSNVYEELEFMARDVVPFGLGLIMPIFSSYCRLRCGYTLKEADAVKQVQRAQLPIIYIHGTADEIVPYSMQEKLYSATPKEFRYKKTFMDTKHVMSLPSHPDEYSRIIKEFVTDNY